MCVPRATVLIFAKLPDAGRVKTRLVPPLSHDEAAVLHKASLLAVCENVGHLRRAMPRIEPIWVVTPDERITDAAAIAGDAVSASWPQGDGDLGQRMERATHRAFAGGAQCVLLLGADSPTLPEQILADAVDQLVKKDAVLGPCEDGGYYLLGLRRTLPELFEDIDWGGPLVLEQTRRRAANAHVELHELPVWYDLDRFGDLQRAAQDMMQDALASPRPARDGLRRLINHYLIRYGDGRVHETQPR